MRTLLIGIFILLIQGPLLAEVNCEATDSICLKKMSRKYFEDGEKESALKISLVNCLYNKDCIDFNEGIKSGFHKKSSIPPIYDAIQFYLEKKPKLNSENSQKETTPVLNPKYIQEIEGLKDSLEKAYSKNKKLQDTNTEQSNKISYYEKKLNSKEQGDQKILDELGNEIKILKKKIAGFEFKEINLRGSNSSLLKENSQLKNENEKIKGYLSSKQEEEKAPIISGAKKALSIWKEINDFIVVNTGLIILVFIILLSALSLTFIVYLKAQTKAKKAKTEAEKAKNEAKESKDFIKDSDSFEKKKDLLRNRRDKKED